MSLLRSTINRMVRIRILVTRPSSTSARCSRDGPRKLTRYLAGENAFLETNRNTSVSARSISIGGNKIKGPLDAVTYETVCEETLESLNDYIDEIMTAQNDAPDSDVSYGDGVLTVKLGKNRGTYVINKQTPNKQIWLSSPISGPKRYDFVDGRWVYLHDGVALHDLLTDEFNQLFKTQTNFTKCAYGRSL